MAVKIRLRRVGAKKQPAYRLVIADARAPRDGRFIEIVGHYNPLVEPAEVVVNRERALYWLRQGATPTDVVKRLMEKDGVWAEFTGQVPPVAPAPPIAAPVEPEIPAPVVETPAAVETIEEPAAEPTTEAPTAEATNEEPASAE